MSSTPGTVLVEIRRWDTGIVIYSGFHFLVKEAIQAMIAAKMCFYRANLRGLILNGITFPPGTDLTEADFTNTELVDVDLRGCILTGTNFFNASVRKAQTDSRVLVFAPQKTEDMP